MTPIWALVMFTTSAAIDDPMPKSLLLYASREACEAQMEKMRHFTSGKLYRVLPDGKSEIIEDAKTHFGCVPVYMDPKEFDKLFGVGGGPT